MKLIGDACVVGSRREAKDDCDREFPDAMTEQSSRRQPSTPIYGIVSGVVCVEESEPLRGIAHPATDHVGGDLWIAFDKTNQFLLE